MAISATGVGSGLDIGGILQQLMAAERQPLVRIQQQQQSYQAKLSAFGQLKSAMSKLQDAATALGKAGTFSATTASVGDSKAVGVTSSDKAQPGSFNVAVEQLARNQRVASSASVAPTVGAGSLTISLGSYGEDGSFNASPDGETTITLEAGASLADLRDAINNADAGVSAQIIFNGTVDQLVISGRETGAAQAFRLSGTDGLAGFSFDAGSPGSSMSSVQQAQDARLSIDGIHISRASNTIDNAIEGVTLNLLKATEEEATVNIARNDEPAKKAIEEFTKAYNELNSLIRSQSSYDEASKKAGALNGDAGLRSIQSQLRGVFANPLSGLDGASMLSEIGLGFKTDGSLSIDNSKLEAALADPAKNVAALFGGNATVAGYASLLETRLKDMLGSDGVLESRTEGINRTIKSYNQRMEAMEARLERVEARYLAQFTALDAAMASMNTTSAYLSQQLAGLQNLIG